jgi:Helix-turn-helix domain
MSRKNETGAVLSHRPASSKQIQFDFRSTATKVQLARLVEKLRRRPHNTLELRAAGIPHPAGRVLDLSKRGFVIDSSRVNAVDSDGWPHFAVALYSLVSEPEVKQ